MGFLVFWVLGILWLKCGTRNLEMRGLPLLHNIHLVTVSQKQQT